MRQRENGDRTETANSENGASHTNGYYKNGNHIKIEEIVQDQGFLMRLVHQTLMPIFLILFSPNLVLLLWYTAVHCDGSFLVLGRYLFENGLPGLLKIWREISYCSTLATYVLVGYCLFALLLMVILPGPRAEGPVTPKGNVPVYKDNGFACFVVTMISLCILTAILKQNGLTPTVVYDHFDEFLGTLTIFSLLLCLLLYFKGLYMPSSTDCGSSGNIIFDYYWGTELYPRIFGIDIKVFTNCRFGMTVWPILVFLFAVKSYELHGFVDSMWVSTFLQMVYFTKFFWWEAGYMKTIDIMVDRAGFYICWGCLVYIAGLYASVSLYLVNHPVHLGPVLSTIILVCGVTSTMINYWADLQKQEVRATDGQCLIWGKKPQVIRAKYELENGETRQSLLLLSGYWGLARHFHYIPEIALAFFWSVPALFDNLMPYLYTIWLVLLLTHRSYRDDDKCGRKYQKYWVEYRNKVPYRIIPYIF